MCLVCRTTAALHVDNYDEVMYATHNVISKIS